jgi:hypothetical protein
MCNGRMQPSPACCRLLVQYWSRDQADSRWGAGALFRHAVHPIPSTRLSLQWERHRPWHMRAAIAPCLYLEVMSAMACLKGNMQSRNTQSTMGFRLDPVYARNCVSLHELVPACQHATLVSTPPRSGCHPSQRCQPVPDNDPYGLPPRLSTQCQEHEANELALIVSLLAPAGTRP